MKTIVLKVRNLPNNVDTDLFVYCMQQDVAASYPKGKVELVPEIVRCKDCVHKGKVEKCVLAAIAAEKDCPLFMLDNRGEWFCADGKRKDDDD